MRGRDAASKTPPSKFMLLHGFCLFKFWKYLCQIKKYSYVIFLLRAWASTPIRPIRQVGPLFVRPASAAPVKLPPLSWLPPIQLSAAPQIWSAALSIMCRPSTWCRPWSGTAPWAKVGPAYFARRRPWLRGYSPSLSKLEGQLPPSAAPVPTPMIPVLAE